LGVQPCISIRFPPVKLVPLVPQLSEDTSPLVEGLRFGLLVLAAVDVGILKGIDLTLDLGDLRAQLRAQRIGLGFDFLVSEGLGLG